MREAFVPRYGYNSDQREMYYLDSDIDLCSDLKLSVVIRPTETSAAAECMLDGVWFSFRTVFNIDGTITVFQRPREIDALTATASPEDDPRRWVQWAQAKTSQMIPGTGLKVEMAHVDHSVKIWVDGDKIIDKSYPVPLDVLKKRLASAADIPLPCPGAKIGAVGGPMELTHIKLMRDVYYTTFQLAYSGSDRMDFLTEYSEGNDPPIRSGSPGWGVDGFARFKATIPGKLDAILRWHGPIGVSEDS